MNTLIRATIALGALILPFAAPAAEINLAKTTCSTYEAEILNAPPSDSHEDALNIVMWLYGYAVAHSGQHAMYSNGLPAFGNALDAECRSRTDESLFSAVIAVKTDNDNPMDLKELDCATFEARHQDMARSDPESARTIMMWLLGFSTGLSAGQVINTAGLPDFDKALAAQCSSKEGQSLYEALAAARVPKKKT
jgi:hypothetical protein